MDNEPTIVGKIAYVWFFTCFVLGIVAPFVAAAVTFFTGVPFEPF